MLVFCELFTNFFVFSNQLALRLVLELDFCQLGLQLINPVFLTVEVVINQQTPALLIILILNTADQLFHDF